MTKSLIDKINELDSLSFRQGIMFETWDEEELNDCVDISNKLKSDIARIINMSQESLAVCVYSNIDVSDSVKALAVSALSEIKGEV